MILYGLLHMFVTVSSPVLLLVFPSLVTVRVSLSQQVVRGDGSPYHGGEGGW
jgi:hypothetical protein